MASLIDFYKQKLAPKITSLIDDWKAKPSNQIGNKLVQSGILGFNSSPGLVGVDTSKPMTQAGLQPKQSSFKPVQYANDRLTNYINNTYLSSTRDIPKAVQQIKQPGIVNKAVGVGRLGFDVLGAVPDPTDALFAGYNYAKGAKKSSRDTGKQFSLANAEAGLKAATLENPVGLGEALFTNPTAQTVGNIAELPLLLGAGVLKGKQMSQVKREALAALKNEPGLINLKGRLTNRETITDINQYIDEGIKLRKDLKDMADEVAPSITKALTKIEKNDPDLWMKQVMAGLEDRLGSAKDPVILAGLQARPLKKVETPKLSVEPTGGRVKGEVGGSLASSGAEKKLSIMKTPSGKYQLVGSIPEELTVVRKNSMGQEFRDSPIFNTEAEAKAFISKTNKTPESALPADVFGLQPSSNYTTPNIKDVEKSINPQALKERGGRVISVEPSSRGGEYWNVKFADGSEVMNTKLPSKPLSVEPVGGKPLVTQDQISPMGRLKTAEIDKTFSKIPDGTVSPDGYVVKRGNKLYPTEKATPEILKNSLIELNPDGSYKESNFGVHRMSFTEDVALKSLSPSPLVGKPVAQGGVGDIKSIPSEEIGLRRFISEPNSPDITPYNGTERLVKKIGNIEKLQGENGSFRYITRNENGEIIGGLQGVSGRGKNILSNIYVDPNVRRQGVATKLLNQAKKDFPDLKISEDQTTLGKAFFSPSKGGVTEPKIVKPLKEVYKEKLSSPTDTHIGQEMVSDLPGKTELNKPLVGESTTPTKVTSESSLTPIISKKGKLNIERLAVDDTGKQALQDINEGIPASVISNKSVIEKAKTAKGSNKPMSDEQMQNLLAQQLKNRQQVVDLSAKFSKAKAEGASEQELGKIMLELANQSRTAQQGGTFAGRLLQAQNIIADNSASPMQKILALLDNAGVSEEKYLKDAVKVDWNKPTEVVQFYRKYVPPSLGEVLTEVRYTNMLSSPLTHIINTASNALQTGIVTPIEKGTTGLLDAARSALTGKERQYYARAGIDYTKGYLSSLPQAIKKAMDVMSQKDISIRPDMEYLPTGVGGPLQAYTTPLRALEAMDQFFKTLVEGGVTRELGKGPKKLTVTQIAKKASDEANYRLFRQSFDPKGELGQGYVLQLFDRWNSAINGLRRLPGGKWVLPFLQTPTNILKQGVEYSPLGLSTIPGAKNPIEQLSKTLIGTGVFATAYQLASSGLTSWEAPSGEKERELYYAAGLQPYSIKVGDKWVSFSKLGPLSYPIAMAAALADAERKNPDQSKVSNIGKSISGMLGFFGDQSYVRSIGDLVDAIQGGVSVGPNAIAGQAANIAGQLVPYKSFLTWLGRITDPTYRKAKTFTERMVKDLPGIGSTLEPYTDVYGNPSKRDLPLVNAISPAKITVEKKSELPLYQKYEDAKIQRGIEKRAGDKLLEGKGSTSGVYQYVNDDGTVNKVDVKKVTSLPESTNYERVKKDQEKWKLADDILNLPAEQQQKAFTDLGISKADAEYYQVAKDTTEAKVAYIKDQVQGVKTYDEFLKKVIPLAREINGSAILSEGVIDWLYNNDIITSAQKKQLKSLEFKDGKVQIKSSGSTKSGYVEAKLPSSAKTALPKVKRIRTKTYKLVVPKAK